LSWRRSGYWAGGVGRGRGGFGLGLQRGYRGRWATGDAPVMPTGWVDWSSDDELAELRAAAAQLEGDLDGVRARITALESRQQREAPYEPDEGGQPA